MDLSKLDLTAAADIGATMTVVHPITGADLLTKNGSKVTITVLGSDSSVLRDEMKTRARRQISRKSKIDIDEAMNSAAEMLATCVVSWDGIEENGEMIACTKENAVNLFIKYQWLRQQVDDFASDRENFFKA